MYDETNNLVRKFYLGDYSAWEALVRLLHVRVLRRLKSSFRNLSEDDLADILSDFEVSFFAKVKDGHEEADRRIRDSSTALDDDDEIAAVKIHCCTVRTKFDLSLGHSFMSWLLVCVYRRVLTFAAGLPPASDIRPDDEEEILLRFPKGYPQQLYVPAEQPGLNDIEVIKKLLEQALEGDELIYLEVWLKHGPDLNARLVSEAIAKKSGTATLPKEITELKQTFFVKVFLVLLEHSDTINSLAALSLKLLKFKGARSRMFQAMMEKVWAAFCADKEIVRQSQIEMSRGLWAQWRKPAQRKKAREGILVAAYRHYRLTSPLPRFCYLIELYSDTRFGGEVRRLFMDGGAEN